MNIDDAIEAVRTFHKRMSAPIASNPRTLPGNRDKAAHVAEELRTISTSLLRMASHDDVLLLRAAMEIEEFVEWLQAHIDEDDVAVADAWADRAYILFGDAVAAGLPASELFNEVHRSNMSKDPATDGVGKAVKGPSYSRPDLKPILKSHSTGESRCGE
jgi:predicted HAD superfamily Cof-like phosphohydrolase